ncbi:hypothetical protein I547_7686 [Mycobacterium kansasii 824]|nr:hypothetical protein I547_7686 [Mycobacterium kansasii 824]
MTAAVTPPAFGALVTAAGYPLAFAVCAIFALAAVPLVPVDSERIKYRDLGTGSF